MQLHHQTVCDVTCVRFQSQSQTLWNICQIVDLSRKKRKLGQTWKRELLLFIILTSFVLIVQTFIYFTCLVPEQKLTSSKNGQRSVQFRARSLTLDSRPAVMAVKFQRQHKTALLVARWTQNIVGVVQHTNVDWRVTICEATGDVHRLPLINNVCMVCLFFVYNKLGNLWRVYDKKNVKKSNRFTQWKIVKKGFKKTIWQNDQRHWERVILSVFQSRGSSINIWLYISVKRVWMAKATLFC